MAILELPFCHLCTSSGIPLWAILKGTTENIAALWFDSAEAVSGIITSSTRPNQSSDLLIPAYRFRAQ
jgi:hypothetical protein